MPKIITFAMIVALVLGGFALPGPAAAQDGILVEVTTDVACDQATFMASADGGSQAFDLSWFFGDEESLEESGVATFPHQTEHTYPGTGEYTWMLAAADVADPELTGMASGSILVGPSVSLTSDVFPPLLTLQDGTASLELTAEVKGGEEPYTYAWALNGHGSGDTDGSSASVSFTAAGKYEVSVTVTDDCGLSAMDSLTIVVFDPGDACHPMAERIAEAVSSIFPDQAEQLYSCEDIFAIFQGELTGSQLGFGRMWHAYQLSQTIDDLTWEEILDWHLDGGGWGLLVQLDKFADALDEVSTGDLVGMVLSGEASIQDIRTSIRAVTRYDADFEDALARLADGANPGELGQLYRLAQELEMDPEALDAYLDAGLSLSDLRHAARVADRFGSDLDSIASAHAEGLSWGQINQAHRLANDETSVDEILEMGIKKFRQSQREQDRAERTQERDERTASRLAAQYGVSVEQIWAVYDGACQGDWKCVRAHFRGEQQHGKGKGRNK